MHLAHDDLRVLVPAAQHATAPLFAFDDGTPFCSDDVASIGADIAAHAGWSAVEVADVGAKCFRIGGATDLRDWYGVERATELLKRRGRWNTDIAQLYARTTVAEMADVSRHIGSAGHAEVERVRVGWAEPARR